VNYSKTHSNEELTIVVNEKEAEIEALWLGRSTAREPKVFIQPILNEIIDLANKLQKSINMDFRKLEYMNSSTITPILRMLEDAAHVNSTFSITYDTTLRWQELNFSALEIFRGKNRNFRLEGK
jgi:hypothetical protein